MYRIVSPSRTNKPSSLTHFPYGRGVSERRWRSAANRPSRQARRGWAALYEAPSQKKNHLPRATKIQQPKIFPHSNKTSPNTFPAQKSLPTLPRSPPGSTPGFFGPNPGQFGSEQGYFGSLLGRFQAFPGQNHTVLGPVSPFPGAHLRPGRRAKTSPPSPCTQAHPLHRNSPKSHKI